MTVDGPRNVVDELDVTRIPTGADNPYGNAFTRTAPVMPVMPVQTCGFRLQPSGFFDRHPALDVPATPGGHCHT